MPRLVAAVLLALLAMVLAPDVPSPPASTAFAADDVVIEVNTATDGPDGVCPGDGACTLRAAIEAANVDVSEATVRIVFDADAFPVADPARIVLAELPLPAITRADVTIDATTSGVIIDGRDLPEVPPPNGLELAGQRGIVEGLAVVHFQGACVRVTGESVLVGGDPTFSEGNRFGDCAVGIEVLGSAAFVLGNRVGFSANGEARSAVGAGIVIDAANVTVGGEDVPARLGNVIGNADIGIQVGTGLAAPFGGTVIARNTFGRDPEGDAARVGTGLLLSQFSGGTAVIENTFANTRDAGIVVAADALDTSVAGNTLRRNLFESRTGPAIDLGGDGAPDANDGLAEGRPNGGIDHPVITRATQARVTGIACAGCTVELYRARHLAGGVDDTGSAPVLIGLVGADETGTFTLESPPVAPGDWLTAIATDGSGNTSEFGPSARVGAGVIQCGNVTLEPGWNLIGFFGLSTLTLGQAFPLDPGGHVAAIYARDNGGDTFRHWFRGNPVEATLTALEPGVAYWFYADEPLTLPQGFSLTAPLPVALSEGWNEFVYFGATAEPLDALASIAGSWAEIHRYGNGPGPDEGWVSLGGPSDPPWLSGAGIEACGAYAIRMTAPALLTPLQP